MPTREAAVTPAPNNARSPGQCSAIGCQALVLPFALFCDRCWPLVESDLARLIGKHHRPNKRPSKVLERYMALAVKELLYLRTEGHRRPRDAEFEWTEDEPTPSGEQLRLAERQGD